MRPLNFRWLPISLACLILWFIWPNITVYLYRASILNEKSVAIVGQFGDLFGGLTAFFTLTTLVFSIYTNYLQLLQFQQIRSDQKLGQSRYFNDKIMNDPDIMNAINLFSNERFTFNLKREDGKILMVFTISGKYLSKDMIYATTQKTFSLFEEYLQFLKNGLVDDYLTVNVKNSMRIVLRSKAAREYLEALDEVDSKIYIELRRFLKNDSLVGHL